jgi:hypothetical protein
MDNSPESQVLDQSNTRQIQVLIKVGHTSLLLDHMTFDYHSKRAIYVLCTAVLSAVSAGLGLARQIADIADST